MRKTVLRELGLVAVAALVTAAIVLGARVVPVHALVGQQAGNCIGDINRLTNPSGFTSADFSSNNAVVVSSGSASAAQLDTNLVPLDPQHIVLPFDQDVSVKYVYRNAGASHLLGWFYFDQLKTGSKPFVKTVNGVDTLMDWDNDGIPDWFQTASGTSRPQDGLWHISSGQSAPDLTNSNYSYVDKSSYYYGHVPHVLELLSGVSSSSNASAHTRDFIFKLCDDDSDTSTYNNEAPAADGVGGTIFGTNSNNPLGVNPDGIPDYDVNSDGNIGNEADRSVDLGTIQGNREIVFFAVTFYSSSMHRSSLGLTGSGNDINASSLPWFTKNLLNPDRGGKTAGTVLQKQAIGCARDDSTCYNSYGATIGWLDQATIDRLNTAPYHNLKLDKTVNTIAVGSDGSAPHFVVNAPSTDPNRWIMALEDLPIWNSDLDYNDVVFMIERTNGGTVTSNNLVKSTDIPSGTSANDYMISKLHLRFSATYPSPGCDNVPDADIQFYWSVDNVTWYPWGLPVHGTSGDVAVDVLAKGVVGQQVYWKANFVSSSQFCQPKLNSVNLGYEAIQHGEYKFAAPVPLANVVFNGSVETSSSQWTVSRNDYRTRGHFYSSLLYDPVTGLDSSTVNWDAGAVLAAQSSSTRQGIFTGVNGAYKAFTASNSTTLYPLILNGNDRVAKDSNGKLIFDFNGDGVSDDLDASYVMEWTRGSEYPQAVPSGITNTERAWKLGAVHNSSPAIVGTPGHPPWLDGTAAALTTFRSAYGGSSWQTSTTVMARRTLALVGAQDGMIHAFDAGNFHNPNEQACASTKLARGCFAPSTTGGSADYGTGKEVFAYVPPTMLNQLKNNVGPVFTNYAAYPEAEVDGSIAVEDIYYQPTSPVSGQPSNQFVTAAFASLGRQWDAITALGWTNMTFSGTTPVSTLPFPLWKSDWTDSDYRGSELSPSVGVAITPSGTQWVVVTTSGLAQPALEGTVKEYLYVIDASNGTTMTNGKIALDATGSIAYGFASFANLVDTDGDGVNDRAYVVDTAGRVFRVNLQTFAKCQIYSVGEPVFSGMAVNVASTSTASKVQLFVGGGANPDGTSVPATGGTLGYPPFHIFGIEDDDTLGSTSCTTASLIWKSAAPSNQSVWATPFVTGSNVFVATSGSTEESVCATGAGTLLGMSTAGSGGTSPTPLTTTPSVSLSNAAISSIRIYDGHAFINGIAKETAIVGTANAWNNKASGGSSGPGVDLATVIWGEQ